MAMPGIDMHKNSCSVAGLGETGRIVLRSRLNRDGVVRLAEAIAGAATRPTMQFVELKSEA